MHSVQGVSIISFPCLIKVCCSESIAFIYLFIFYASFLSFLKFLLYFSVQYAYIKIGNSNHHKNWWFHLIISQTQQCPDYFTLANSNNHNQGLSHWKSCQLTVGDFEIQCKQWLTSGSSARELSFKIICKARVEL